METIKIQRPLPSTCRIISLTPGIRREESIVYKIAMSGKLVWPTLRGFECMCMDEILFLKAQSNYTEIHTRDRKILLSKTLKSIEQQLSQALFCRVHNSYVVNVRNVKSFVSSPGNAHLTLDNDVCIPVSKSGKSKMIWKDRSSNICLSNVQSQ